MKKVLTIQSFASYGKCAGSLALPVLSAMGMQTTLLPTAYLSTHTGFKDFTFRDMTEEMQASIKHFEALHLHFDAVYVGYLGSLQQLQLVQSLHSLYPDALWIVDPAMGDNGNLYSRVTPDFIEAYRSLCGEADYILPNLTEACALAGLPYTPQPDSLALLRSLQMLGASHVVLTGLSDASDSVGSMLLTPDGTLVSAYQPQIPGHFHGTGDLFASAFCGALLRGLSDDKALTLATTFTQRVIAATAANSPAEPDSGAHWHGLLFEEELPWLIKAAFQC